MIRDRLHKPDGLSIPYIWNVRDDHRMILLCQHGFTGSKDSPVIAALMRSLDKKGVGVVAFDWPAHGESDAPDGNLTVENCLADLELMLDHIRTNADAPISCFATSYGGYLTTLYRNAHPDVFSYLILRSPALKMAEVSRGLITEEQFQKLNGEDITVGEDRKIKVGKKFYDSLCRHEAFSPAPPCPENIMIIQGDEDDVVNPQDTFEYAEKNNIKINVFKGTDHIYRKPGEIDRIVEVTEEFLLPRV